MQVPTRYTAAVQIWTQHTHTHTQPSVIEPDIMTPVESYVVFYGENSSPLLNVTTSSTTTKYNISGLTVGGNYTVGVAALNSAGTSEITYITHILCKFYYVVVMFSVSVFT